MSGREAQESSAGGRLIKRYLKELNRMARVLPPARRTELIQDVRSHIDVALNERGNQDAEAVSAVLDGLGKPAEIVAAALADNGVEASPVGVGIGGHEIAAVLLLLFGAAAVGIGWLAGVLLLWSSPRWTMREKLVGTAILPGGVVGPAFLASRPVSGSSFLQTLLMLVALAAPVLAALWLVQRARTAVVSDGAARWAAGIVAVGAVALALPLVGLAFFSATRTDQGPSTPVSVTGDVVVTPTQSPS
jgi:hypothetical protein